MKRPKAILLDIDGTLLDSNDAHARAWVDVLRRAGHDVSYAAIRPLIGKGGDKLLVEAAGIDASCDAGRRLVDAQGDAFDERLPKLAPTRGARALLERLRDVGLALVVATSAGGDALAGLLKQAGVSDLIEDAATTKDANASKPDPDIVEAALRKAGVDASRALMLGDTPHDIAAAREAGVETIALRCGGWWSDAALAGALAIRDHPQALLESWDDVLAMRQA